MGRILRRVTLWLGAIIAGLLGLVVVALVLVTQVPVLRTRLAAWGERLLLEYGEVDLRAEQVVRLDPWGAELRKAHVEIPEIGLSADVARVRVSFRPWALLALDVRFSSAHLEGVRAELGPPVSAPLTPAEIAEEAAEDPADEWGTTLERVSLRDGELVSYQTSDAVLHIDSLRGAVAYRETLDVRVERAVLGISRHDEKLLEASTLSGSYRGAVGGTLRLRGQLAGAPLSLAAGLPAWDGDDQPVPLDALHVSLGGIDRGVLRQLGLEVDLPLRTPVDLGLSLRREGQRLRGAFQLRGEGATLRGRGSWRTGRVELSLDGRAASLSTLVSDLPDQSLRGSVEVDYRYGERSQALSALWGPWILGKRELPSGRLKVRLRGANVVVDELQLTDKQGSVTGHGSYQLESGEAQANLTVHALKLSAFSALIGDPVAGALTGSLGVVRAPDGEMRVESRFMLGEPRYGDALGARRISGELVFSGTTSRPKLVATLEAQELRVSTTLVPRLSTKVALETRNFAAYVEGTGENTKLRGVLSGLLDLSEGAAPGVTLRAELDGRLAGRELSLRLSELSYADSNLTLRGLALRSGMARLDARGKLTKSGEIELELNTKDLPLNALGALAGVPDLMGKLTVRAAVTGDREHPVLSLDATALEVSLDDSPLLDTVLTLSFDAAQRKASGQLAGYGALGHALGAAFELTWPTTSHDLHEALPLGEGRVYATASAPVSALPLPSRYGLSGLDQAWLEMSANLEGSLGRPQGLITLSLRESQGGPPQLDAKALVTGESASLDLSASDNRRADPLLKGHVEIALPSEGLLQLGSSLKAASPELEARVEWQVDALDQLRGALARVVRRFRADLPLRTSGALVLTRARGHLQGSLQATVDLRSALLDPDCPADTNADLLLQADVDDERVRGSVTAETNRGGNAFVNVVLPTPWLWSWPEHDDGKAATLDAEAENIPLYALPGLCSLDNGQASLSLSSVLTPKKPPTTNLTLHVEGLSTSNADPIAAEMKLKMDASSLYVFAALDSRGEHRGTLEATLPLRYHGYTPGVVLTEPVSARFQASDLSIAPLVQFTQAVGRPSGKLSADIQLAGSLRKPQPKGTLSLEGLSFTLASLAQPIRNLRGRIEFAGDTVTLHDVSTQDRSGKLYLNGNAKLLPDGSANAKLDMRAEDMPVRRQGQIVGKATLGADLMARLDQSAKLVVDAAVRYATLQFSGTTGKSVQALDAHPDIRFAGEPAEETTIHIVDKPSGFELLSFEVKSEKDIMLQHRDFSVQVGLDLALKNVHGEEKLVGEARITRGNLKLLGKSFNIQRGSVRFTEESSEPELDLRATFEPPGGGTPLNVQVSGRASNPALNFSGAADTPEQAFAIMSGLGTAEAAANAQADVNAFGLSLTAGLLSMTARQQLGGWVPTVSVGSNSRGQASQARAGFDASKMIPHFLRGFARGAYVEGIVGQTQQGGGGSVGVGVRLELALPRSIVTTFTYGPGTNWSADVAWSP